MTSFVKNIGQTKGAIVALGYWPTKNHVSIIGTGFAISEDGKIATCAHVYNQVPKEAAVNFKALVLTKIDNGIDNYNWVPLKLLKKDDQKDVAILQLESIKDTLIKPLEIGDSEQAEVGQEVYFMGFPYATELFNEGYGLTLHVAKTIISNIKRDGIDPKHPKNWLFVDTINNPGNSGAPLIDIESNKVIGFMAIAFRMKSHVQKDLDIREPMHIGGAKPINFLKDLINT